MNSGKPLERRSSFSIEQIPRFSVIRVRYQFAGEYIAKSKLLVVLHHRQGHAICIKATSNTFQYENNDEQMAGCVYYKAGQIPCFPVNTAIQPDNQIPVAHSHIEAEYLAGHLEVFALPDDFQSKLQEAVKNSVVLNKRERERIAALIS
jgi:hypothetical protein